MFIPQAFTFENLDSEGRGLCLGETVILQEEINPFMSRLREHNIIVTAVHNHWLFDEPRLMYMHFESIDRPLTFARKVRDAMDVLISRDVHVKSSSHHDEFNNSFKSKVFEAGFRNQHSNTSHICDEFNRILGGTMHTFENEQCIVMKSRLNIRPESLTYNLIYDTVTLLGTTLFTCSPRSIVPSALLILQRITSPSLR